MRIINKFLPIQQENSKKNLWKEAEKKIGIIFPELIPFDFYYGKSGLFPWGITDNGDELLGGN